MEIAPEPASFVELTPVPEPVSVKASSATSSRDIYSSKHSDVSGDSREIVIASVLAGKDSGVVTMHLTPAEEREYNSGMARLAELG